MTSTAPPPRPAAELRFSPYDYAIHEDPYPTYARLRDEAPLFHNPEVGFWALSRHADVIEAFRDSARYSSALGVSLEPSAYGPHAHRTSSFIAMDPPRHGRMRGLVSRAFTPRRVADLEPRIRELTRHHLDRALAGGDSFDLIGDLAGLLPMDVISELIGVPAADRAELRRLADLVLHREDGNIDVPTAGAEAALELVVYYAAMVADRRARRRDDLTSALVDAELDGERLADDDIIAFLFLMVVAGNETTTKLLGHAWYWAWRNPGERAAVLADPGRVPDWVEETLRYDTSSQFLVRTATEDVALHGGVIPAGERVLLMLGSANRDPRAFDDPDTFRLDRRHDVQLASFGVGRHFCLGASLARLESRVALEELVARVADYDIDEVGARRVHSANVRGFATLPTIVTRR
ncbi:MAG TPA: cytochrome P450 [Acidimicrobiales bacterium]|nr:cytochrome P450 [Acidimicrobiales bacterium]